MKKANATKAAPDKGVKVPARDAGILLHISSLPSRFGIGDLGPESLRFADFLQRCRQKYWQLLPLNPSGAEQGYSPYSSVSGMAGNPLLISPELLANENLLDKRSLDRYNLPILKKVNYKEAERLRKTLFDTAHTNFLRGEHGKMRIEYQKFIEKEDVWLDDFATFTVLKEHHHGKPWYRWRDEYKLRYKKSIATFCERNTEEIEKVKWLQFIFSNQWHAVKAYCNTRGIQLFGDMPFYVSYDSADVWSHPEIFSIGKEGNIIGIAGVPPDYFNANGQLWGMPVFKWDILKKTGYAWWIHRMKKNIELFDLLRLDHFRAFASYWEVPAKEKTAKRGRWKAGPGVEIFKVFRKELGKLPFVAEDLGDINDTVRDLRQQFKLPGMKVLHFAFAENMPVSEYIPHNYTGNFIAYTGTHDNNTTRGWYRKDLNKDGRKRLQQYAGMTVNERNVHIVLSRMAYASVAKTAILPMQDVLGLSESARMNMPASAKNNWLWRMQPGKLMKEEKMLLELTRLFNRG